MFSKFTSVLQSAVDALAPPLGQQERFCYHWKAITHYFVDNSNNERVPVESTSIPRHLEQMLGMLHAEEQNDAETKQCFDYLLQHKILETLYALGRADSPPGMKQHALLFFTHLLSRTSRPILQHMNVHRPIKRVIRLCGETLASPCETEEIRLLGVVCAKIKANPSLINFFIEGPPNINQHAESKEPNNFDEDSASSASSINIGKKLDYPIVTSLLSLVQSADSHVSLKACESLLLCASLPADNAAHLLVHHTPFCGQIVTQIAKLYTSLPKDVHPVNVDSVQAKWGFDQYSDKEDIHIFAGKRQLLSFFSWFDYCDQLIYAANPHVGRALSREIRKVFLFGMLQPDLMHVCEKVAAFATSLLMHCLRMVVSPILLQEFAWFLLEGTEKGIQTSGKLKRYLIQRCNHPSDELSIVTMKLFQVLLQKPSELIFQYLILDNISVSTPLDQNQDSNITNKQTLLDKELPELVESNNDLILASYDDRTVEDYSGQQMIGNSNHVTSDQWICTDESDVGTSEKTLVCNDESAKNQTSSSYQLTFDQEEVREIDFPGIVPTEVNDCVNSSDTVEDRQSPSSVMTDTDTPKIQTDIAESASDKLFGDLEHTNIQHTVNLFLSLVPPECSSCEDTEDSAYETYLKDAHRQYQGVLIQCKEWSWKSEPNSSLSQLSSLVNMLLDKLHRLLDESYEINLQVTSLLSKLALFPHSQLHELLLTPNAENECSLYSVLAKVSNELNARMHRIQNFRQTLIHARRKLTAQELESSGHDRLLYGVIVLEEFCKELAAIVFVKYHSSSSTSGR